MSVFVADDVTFIAKRLAELQKEMQDALARDAAAPAPPACRHCDDAGWRWSLYLTAHVLCTDCNNPGNKARP